MNEMQNELFLVKIKFKDGEEKTFNRSNVAPIGTTWLVVASENGQQHIFASDSIEYIVMTPHKVELVQR